MDNTVKLIRRIAGIDFDLTRCRSNDPQTFALLQSGDAKGVFQLESDGIRELLKRMKPDNIRDLIATNALYRPGPLGGGMVDAYINRKHGREKAVYQHPLMEEILSRNLWRPGLPGASDARAQPPGRHRAGQAYACIKAISKKKQEIIDARRVGVHQGGPGTRPDRPDGRDDFRADHPVSPATVSTSRTVPPTPRSATKRRT